MELITDAKDERLTPLHIEDLTVEVLYDSLRAALTREAEKDAKIRGLEEDLRMRNLLPREQQVRNAGVQEGFDHCHEPAKCGHARANYKDPKYGTPEYDGDEACEFCAYVIKAESRLAASEAQLCTARELLDEIYNNCGCEEEDGTLCANCDRNIAFFADKTSSPCRHEAEAKRLRESVEWACNHIPDELIEAYDHSPIGSCRTRAFSGTGFKAELRRRADAAKGGRDDTHGG